MNDNQNIPIPLDELQLAVLPLIAFENDQIWHPLGTAFVVAIINSAKHALLLTASHNLKYALQIDSPNSRHHSTTPQEFLPKASNNRGLKTTYVRALLPIKNNGFAFINMVTSWTYEAIDVTVMLVEIPPNVEATFTKFFNIDTRTIAVDTPVMAVGYPDLIVKYVEPSEVLRVDLAMQLQCRTGKVLQVCPNGDGMYKWPGFFVNFPFDSAMSGGPLIDMSGETPVVRGLICGDISEDIYDQKRGSGLRAFASMLRPSLYTNIPIQLKKKDGSIINITCFADLIEHGVIKDLAS